MFVYYESVIVAIEIMKVMKLFYWKDVALYMIERIFNSFP